MIRNVSKIELIILVAILVIGVALGAMFINNVNAIDLKILNFVRTNFDHGFVKDFMYLVSLLLSPIPMGILFVIISLASKDKAVAIHIILNTTIALLLNFLLKNIFQRERPVEFFLIDETGYSFPSAHSMVGVAFYGTMIYAVGKYFKNKKISLLFQIVLWIAMILTPVSRVYLGVHNFTDVLVGSYIGAIIVRASIFVVNKIEKKEELSMLDEAKEKKKSYKN